MDNTIESKYGIPRFHVKLFTVHSGGKVGSWEILVATPKNQLDSYIVQTSTKVLGGKSVETVTEITEGKNIGKANETNPFQQALSEAESKVNKKIDQGYTNRQPEAGTKVTNGLGFIKPMLAQPIEKVKQWNFPVHAQTKFDGHRMLATVQDGKVVLYSRQGKVVSVAHIQDMLQRHYEHFQVHGTGWDGQTLDGEIYCHGETLQKISSMVKKPCEESKTLKYHVYDVVMDFPYEERLSAVRQATELLDDEFVQATVTHIVLNHGELDALHAKNLSEGYEGTIVRHGDLGYEDGKRSRSLMKKKDFMDDEFEIIGHLLGKPDIRGDVRYERPIFKCKTKDGVEFTCTAFGTMQERHALFEAGLDDVIGKTLTLKFFNYTPDGAPFLPIALRFKDFI